jgi:hypothetical protein
MRVPYVVFVVNFKFGQKFEAWRKVHDENTEIRTGCCNDVSPKALYPGRLSLLVYFWISVLRNESISCWLSGAYRCSSHLSLP